MSGTTTAKTSKHDGFSDDERAAMKEHARELKSAARRDPATARAEAEREVLAKIEELPEPDRAMARRLHEIVTAAAPDLAPKLWYGMPAYAKNGKLVCFFQNSHKFKARYSTLGFNDAANLDDGDMWPTAYALIELTPAVEARITELVARAAA